MCVFVSVRSSLFVITHSFLLLLKMCNVTHNLTQTHALTHGHTGTSNIKWPGLLPPLIVATHRVALEYGVSSRCPSILSTTSSSRSYATDNRTSYTESSSSSSSDFYADSGRVSDSGMLSSDNSNSSSNNSSNDKSGNNNSSHGNERKGREGMGLGGSDRMAIAYPPGSAPVLHTRPDVMSKVCVVVLSIRHVVCNVLLCVCVCVSSPLCSFLLTSSNLFL